MSRAALRLLAFALLLSVSSVGACGGTTTTAVPPDGASAAADIDERAIDRGRRLAKSKACLGCHSTDGREMLGPTWRGLFGGTVRLEGRGEVEVDDAYLRQSITEPGSDIVEGFDDLMTVTALREDEVDAIIAYIKTLE